METLDKWRVFLELVKLIIWPTFIIIIILLFRKSINSLLSRLKSAKVAGIELEVERKLEAKIEEVVEAIGVRRTEQTEVGEKTIQVDENKNTAGFNDAKSKTMLSFAAGKSIAENLKYNIYYDPADRNHLKPFKYLGLYYDQCVRFVGEVKKTVYCNLVDDKLVGPDGTDLKGVTEEEYIRIKSTIENAYVEYDIEYGHKFHLVDNFYETYFNKVSPGGIMSKKYFWLDEIEGFRHNMTAEQLAKLLDGKTWE